MPEGYNVIAVKESKSLRRRVEEFIDSNFVTIFMTIVTVFALFGDDIRVLAFSKSADVAFYSVSCA